MQSDVFLCQEHAIQAMKKSLYLRLIVSEFKPADLDRLLDASEVCTYERNHVVVKIGKCH